MMCAYNELHRLGLAHSIEVWRTSAGARRLVGGLYGVSLGRMFFGESMFSREPDASKIALCHLARQLCDWGFWLIDCQISNPHLTSLGAEEMPRRAFIELVERNAHQTTREGPWQLEHFPPATWQKQN
jgi:leucyl/phenylalanyl-tRNA--protein transferase